MKRDYIQFTFKLIVYAVRMKKRETKDHSDEIKRRRVGEGCITVQGEREKEREKERKICGNKGQNQNRHSMGSYKVALLFYAINLILTSEEEEEPQLLK